MNENIFTSAAPTPLPADGAAIDKEILGQLAVIGQAMSIIKLTSDSLLEPEDDAAIGHAGCALDGAHTLLETVLERLEAVSTQIRGGVEPAHDE